MSTTLKTSRVKPGYQWLTADEAAVYLDMSATIIRRLIKRGALKAVTIGTGRQYRTTRSWCDDYVQSIQVHVEDAYATPVLEGLYPAQSRHVKEAYRILDEHDRKKERRQCRRS